MSNMVNNVLTASPRESLTKVCLHMPCEALCSAICTRLQQALRNDDSNANEAISVVIQFASLRKLHVLIL